MTREETTTMMSKLQIAMSEVEGMPAEQHQRPTIAIVHDESRRFPAPEASEEPPMPPMPEAHVRTLPEHLSALGQQHATLADQQSELVLAQGRLLEQLANHNGDTKEMLQEILTRLKGIESFLGL